MAPQTSQDRGRAWERTLSAATGLELQRGSGNGVGAKLDLGVAGILLIEAKHTDSSSYRLSRGMLDKVASAVLGPSAPGGGLAMMAIHFGSNPDSLAGAIAVVDLAQQLEWLRKPPELIQSSGQDSIRATARTPPLFR